MMETNFQAKGWLGLILGKRLYYAFCDAELDSVEEFESRVDLLTREIGERGRRPAHDASVGMQPPPQPQPQPPQRKEEEEDGYLRRSSIVSAPTVPGQERFPLHRRLSL